MLLCLALMVFAALTTATVPARATRLGEIEILCPIDGKRFKALTAFSGFQFGAGLDLMPLGPTPAPWPLAKCPGNGFVIYKEKFSPKETDRLKTIVRSAEYRALTKVHTTYFLAAQLQSTMGEPAYIIANTLLRAT